MYTKPDLLKLVERIDNGIDVARFRTTLQKPDLAKLKDLLAYIQPFAEENTFDEFCYEHLGFVAFDLFQDTPEITDVLFIFAELPALNASLDALYRLSEIDHPDVLPLLRRQLSAYWLARRKVSANGIITAHYRSDLVAALSDASPYVRHAAVKQLEENHDSDGLIVALNNFDVFVRASATWALGRLGVSKSVTVLSKRLLDESEYEAQRAIIWTLGMVGDKSVQSIIERHLSDANPVVRNTAEQALRTLRKNNPI